MEIGRDVENLSGIGLSDSHMLLFSKTYLMISTITSPMIWKMIAIKQSGPKFEIFSLLKDETMLENSRAGRPMFIVI